MSNSSKQNVFEKEVFSVIHPKDLKFEINDAGITNKQLKKNYHTQRISQSKWAFRLSFWGCIIGVFTIIGGIFGRNSANSQLGLEQWIPLFSGAVIEAISLLCFDLSNKANDKISEFFSELTKEENVKNAIMLSETVEDTNIKDRLKTKLSLYLVGLDEDKICKNYVELCNKDD